MYACTPYMQRAEAERPQRQPSLICGCFQRIINCLSEKNIEVARLSHN